MVRASSPGTSLEGGGRSPAAGGLARRGYRGADLLR
jgi:hypothetical protein